MRELGDSSESIRGLAGAGTGGDASQTQWRKRNQAVVPADEAQRPLAVASAPAAALAPTCDHSDASQTDRQSWPSQLCTGAGRGPGQ